MIFVIDDKVLRQEQDFGWTAKAFDRFTGFVHRVHDLEALQQRAEEIFQSGNAVLYHESFLDNTLSKEAAQEKRRKLEEYAQNNDGFFLVFFSGSINSRRWNGNIAYAPVSIVYQNLRTFSDKYRSGQLDLGYLLFGSNPNLEQELLDRRDSALGKTVGQPPGELEEYSNLWVNPFEGRIGNPLNSFDTRTLFNDVTDAFLSNKVGEWLSEKKYDNIFIPLCFGQVLSDYNGLRLATMIRCTETENQLSKIIIYGYVGVEHLWGHNYFNILKTKNVYLIDCSKASIEKAGRTNPESFSKSQLPVELAKLKLDLPKNYEDNHSVINEWAINQWAKTIGATDADELIKVSDTISTNLYFKYLKTLHPVSEDQVLSDSEMGIRFKGKPSVLLIDDEARKGWKDVLANLLTNESNYPDKQNRIQFKSVGEGFRKMTTDEIIEQSMRKVEKDEIDVVILDYRLKADDFSRTEIEEMTSVRLLKRIKRLNPGIQVIMFSASNDARLLNKLNSLEGAKIDGFVSKGEPGVPANETVSAFIDTLQAGINRVFLQSYFEKTKAIKDKLQDCDTEDDTDFDDFVRDLEKHVQMLETSMLSIDLKSSSTLDIVFLSCFNFLEKFKDYYLKKHPNGHYLMGLDEVKLIQYELDDRTTGIKFRPSRNLYVTKKYGPSWFQFICGLLVDYLKVCTISHSTIREAWDVKEWRNDYIHNKKPAFEQTEVLTILDLCLKTVGKLKE